MNFISCVCGEFVDDVRGSHALSCKRNSGRIIHHNYLNDIIHRSLNHAGIPATRELQGLFRSDGKRPDGLTLTPWRDVRCFICDITEADITTSYLPTTAITAGSAAELAATRKLVKYNNL